jgi:hypothetical protein
MSEKLGIKIEGPVRIGIEPPLTMSLAGWYYFFAMASFFFTATAALLLSTDVFHLPFSNTLYQFLDKWIPLNF